MRLKHNEVNFDIKYEGHPNCSMSIPRGSSDNHMSPHNRPQYIWASLYQVNALCFLSASSIVDFLTFDILHMIHFGHILTYVILLKPLQWHFWSIVLLPEVTRHWWPVYWVCLYVCRILEFGLTYLLQLWSKIGRAPFFAHRLLSFLGEFTEMGNRIEFTIKCRCSSLRPIHLKPRNFSFDEHNVFGNLSIFSATSNRCLMSNLATKNDPSTYWNQWNKFFLRVYIC